MITKLHKNEDYFGIYYHKTGVKFTNDITFSSSHLLNKFGYVYTDTQNKFVNKIKIKNNFDSIKQSIDKLKNLKVLVIGETIIDQYVFCEVLGKSGKEILKDASMKWKFDYEEKKSLTSEESLIVKISNLKKKNG